MVSTALSQAERLARFRLYRSSNIGPATFNNLLLRFGSAVAALDALPGMLAEKKNAKSITLATADSIEQEWSRLDSLGCQIIFRGEEGFPPLLAAASDSPPFLICRGHPHLLQKPALGIVGARDCSVVGLKIARDCAQQLGQQGYTVVSGLARGIDTAAHQGSLATGTIAVVAGGIDIIYPPQNEALYRSIMEQGLIVTEMPPGLTPQARHFPWRNRIIAGLSIGILVVEAGLKSGSLITAHLAIDQGRDVFAIPGSPLDPRAAGPNELIRNGACLVTSSKDIIAELRNNSIHGLSEEYRWNQQSSTPAPPPDQSEVAALARQITEQLSFTPIHLDELTQLLQSSANLVMAAVTDLELEGIVGRAPGGKVMLLPD